MKTDRTRDGRRDDAVRSLLRQTAPPAPVDRVDWHALHERIMADAVAHAAWSTRAPGVWEIAARWAIVAVPVGVAAGFVATLALARMGPVSDVRPSVVAAMRGEMSVASVADSLVAPDAARWVMAAVVGE